MHEKYMQRCLELARLGMGTTAPNPMVGCVIVHQQQIIGEGYHLQPGMPHAEVMALNSVKNKALLKESILYVNLEPCSHTGRTPPCSDAILKAEVPHVVMAILDSNPQVSGQGKARLEKAGCRVECGILESEARDLNRRFFYRQEKKRPYIVLKWAESPDGYIDHFRSGPDIAPAWITDETCRVLVHRWRTEEAAIMVGTNTALYDNPRLNARSWPGKQPLRIVLDRSLRLPPHLHVFDQSQETLLLNQSKTERSGKTEWIKTSFRSIPEEICQLLYEKEIVSVMVEGGTRLLNSFLEIGLWDEARIFTGNSPFGHGIKGPSWPDGRIREECISGFRLSIIRKEV